MAAAFEQLASYRRPCESWHYAQERTKKSRYHRLASHHKHSMLAGRSTALNRGNAYPSKNGADFTP